MGFIENKNQKLRIPADGSGHRPPGAVSEAVFLAECIQCRDCVAVCPRDAIRPDQQGYPFLSNPTECSSCGLCADVCMHKAIRLTDATRSGLKALMALDHTDAGYG